MRPFIPPGPLALHSGMQTSQNIFNLSHRLQSYLRGLVLSGRLSEHVLFLNDCIPQRLVTPAFQSLLQYSDTACLASCKGLAVD